MTAGCRGAVRWHLAYTGRNIAARDIDGVFIQRFTGTYLINSAVCGASTVLSAGSYTDNGLISDYFSQSFDHAAPSTGVPTTSDPAAIPAGDLRNAPGAQHNQCCMQSQSPSSPPRHWTVRRRSFGNFSAEGRSQSCFSLPYRGRDGGPGVGAPTQTGNPIAARDNILMSVQLSGVEQS
jgi:hypothetical protein